MRRGYLKMDSGGTFNPLRATERLETGYTAKFRRISKKNLRQ